MSKGASVQAESIKNYEEYKTWVVIDKFSLDDEVAKHAALHQQIGEELAEAKSFRDQAEVNVDILKADLNTRFRIEAISEGGPKPTEDSLKNRVTHDRRVVEAQQEYLNWKHIADLWYSLDKAFGERWPMLQELGKLCLSGYYEKPGIKIGSDHKFTGAPNRVAERVREDQTRHRAQRETNRGAVNPYNDKEDFGERSSK